MLRLACLSAIVVTGPFLCFVMSDESQKGDQPTEGVGRISAGEFIETDENGEQSAMLRLKVDEVTPNIIVLSGINGWVAFASYDESKKEYRGYFEWKNFGEGRSPGGKWADLYEVRLIRKKDGNLLMTGKSKDNDFVIRATPKK